MLPWHCESSKRVQDTTLVVIFFKFFTSLIIINTLLNHTVVSEGNYMIIVYHCPSSHQYWLFSYVYISFLVHCAYARHPPTCPTLHYSQFEILALRETIN